MEESLTETSRKETRSNRPKTQEAVYSCEFDIVKEATADLISNNAEYLIKYIYDHQEQAPYNKAEVRVGLVIKTLLKASGVFPSELMTPVVEDINTLLQDQTHLRSFPSPGERRSALMQELAFVNKYQQLDDLISLNTMARG